MTFICALSSVLIWIFKLNDPFEIEANEETYNLFIGLCLVGTIAFIIIRQYKIMTIDVSDVDWQQVNQIIEEVVWNDGTTNRDTKREYRPFNSQAQIIKSKTSNLNRDYKTHLSASPYKPVYDRVQTVRNRKEPHVVQYHDKWDSLQT